MVISNEFKVFLPVQNFSGWHISSEFLFFPLRQSPSPSQGIFLQTPFLVQISSFGQFKWWTHLPPLLTTQTPCWHFSSLSQSACRVQTISKKRWKYLSWWSIFLVYNDNRNVNIKIFPTSTKIFFFTTFWSEWTIVRCLTFDWSTQRVLAEMSFLST